MNEYNKIKEYVRLVMDMNVDTENTIPLLYTETLGVLTPNRVQELIAKGYIEIIIDTQEAA